MHADRRGVAEIRPERRLSVQIKIDVVGDGPNMRRGRRQVHEGQAGEVGVNDFVHLGVRADLEKVRKIVLNLDQWTPRGNLEHERCVAKQGSIANRGNEGVVGALNDFKTNGPTAKTGAQEIL